LLLNYDGIVNLSKVDIRNKIRAIVILAGTVDVGKRREELLEYARRADSETRAVVWSMTTKLRTEYLI
jgi:hypothetical protein